MLWVLVAAVMFAGTRAELVTCSRNNSCSNKHLGCSDKNCTILCYDTSCMNTTIDARGDTASLIVDCLGKNSCQEARITCPTMKNEDDNRCRITCHNRDSCKKARLFNTLNPTLSCITPYPCEDKGEEFACNGTTMNNQPFHVKRGDLDCSLSWSAWAMKFDIPFDRAADPTYLARIEKQLRSPYVSSGSDEKPERKLLKVNISYLCPLTESHHKPASSSDLSKKCFFTADTSTAHSMHTLAAAGLFAEVMIESPSSDLHGDEAILREALQDAGKGEGPLAKPTADGVQLSPIPFADNRYMEMTQSSKNGKYSRAAAEDWKEPEGHGGDSSDTELSWWILIGALLVVLVISVMVGTIVIRGRSRAQPTREGTRESMLKLTDFVSCSNHTCLEKMAEADMELHAFWAQENTAMSPMAAANSYTRKPEMRSRNGSDRMSRSSSESSEGGGVPAISLRGGRGRADPPFIPMVMAPPSLSSRR